MKTIENNIRKVRLAAAVVLLLSGALYAQIPFEKNLKILRAEDSLDPAGAHSLLEDKEAAVRARAALAAGRIGSESSVALLERLLNDRSLDVRMTAAFALGEIESVKASNTILGILRTKGAESFLLSRAVEAAGKIAAANAEDPVSKELGEAILDVLEAEDRKGAKQDKQTILLAMTAALRARPEEADYVLAKFFTNMDWRVRADAANAFARVRGTRANKQLQIMLMADENPVVRANAARALGGMSDKTAINLLFEASETDPDVRVRINAVRALGQIAEPATLVRLRRRLGEVLSAYKASNHRVPTEQTELYELASAVGRAARDSGDSESLDLLKEANRANGFRSPEIETAIATIDPAGYWAYLSERRKEPNAAHWNSASAAVQGMLSISDFLKSEDGAESRLKVIANLKESFPREIEKAEGNPNHLMVVPPFLRLISALDPPDAEQILRDQLNHRDVFIRAAAAGILGGREPSKGNAEALQKAFASSLETDKDYNDAQMSILSALVRIDKESAVPSLREALSHYDLLVRRQAADLIKANGLLEKFPEVSAGKVRAHDKETFSKLGQLLNTDEDYKRALNRKNGKWKAVVTTGKGSFDIDLFPEDAPLTVDNFIKLANSGYFNGISIHRVVGNFVVQDGDPRGDGNGGPGWSIRCEINFLPYERGAIGMALSGKDTGGSQWFVTHSPQPHLDGGYTVFGSVNEDGLKIVDLLARGDRIEKMEIVEKR